MALQDFSPFSTVIIALSPTNAFLPISELFKLAHLVNQKSRPNDRRISGFVRQSASRKVAWRATGTRIYLGRIWPGRTKRKFTCHHAVNFVRAGVTFHSLEDWSTTNTQKRVTKEVKAPDSANPRRDFHLHDLQSPIPPSSVKASTSSSSRSSAATTR
ncbi:hypothetical protein V5O48_012693 [Marasmius crinis-equi]|uniref:Uncharacterized protein n=1 Tax=Marasmius crinis-equi TaxID=585013 RepID=A0ABR3F2N9_9AGAR